MDLVKGRAVPDFLHFQCLRMRTIVFLFPVYAASFYGAVSTNVTGAILIYRRRHFGLVGIIRLGLELKTTCRATDLASRVISVHILFVICDGYITQAGRAVARKHNK